MEGVNFRLGSTMVVRLFCKQGVVGSTPTQGLFRLYDLTYVYHYGNLWYYEV